VSNERRIQARDFFVGSGMMNTPEKLEELQDARARHERLTRGKPSKPFKDLLEQKMKQGRGDQDEQPEEQKPEEKEGAKDPLLSLSPAQKPAIANRAKGRRSGQVIVKG
jgi:hypothetical protein